MYAEETFPASIDTFIKYFQAVLKSSKVHSMCLRPWGREFQVVGPNTEKDLVLEQFWLIDWLIALNSLTLSPANHNDYLRTDWNCEKQDKTYMYVNDVYIIYTQHVKLISKS